MTTSLVRRIFRLAMPIAIQSMLVSVLSMSDVFMVTGLGASSVAAVGLSARVHFLLIVLMASFGMAVSILVAQFHGKGDHKPSQSIVAIGVGFGLLFLLPFCFLLLIFPQHLLSLLSQDAEMIGLGVGYLRLTVPLLIATHVIVVYESGLRARGETVLPLVMSSVAIVLNIILNYLLIHGVWIFPTLGVSGVAIASDIARYVQLALILWYLHRYHHAFAMRFLWVSLDGIRDFLPRFFNTAWPIVINFSLWGLGTFGHGAIAALVGTQAIAAVSLVGPIEALYHSLFMGLSTACAVLIGQHLGRDEFAEARLLASRFTIFSPLGSACVGVCILVASVGFMPLLLEKDSPLHSLSMQLLTIICLTFWLKTLNMTLINGILRAGGDNKYVLGVDMLSMWGVGIPASLLAAFVFDLSYVWVYSMILLDEIVKALFCGVRVWQGRWLNNLTEPKPSNPTAGSS